jgi:SAM-dependent methyltransferase
MNETSKLVEKRKSLGIYDKYFIGSGLEIGGWNDPLIINGKPIKQHTLPDGSTHKLSFKDNEFDFLYASHVLEHFSNTIEVLKEWLRVVKPGGYVYFAVPDFFLYEKCCNPSRYNNAHKAFFCLPSGLYAEKPNAINLEEFLIENFSDHEIKELRIEDNNYNYDLSDAIDQTRGNASCQIDCCLRKK